MRFAFMLIGAALLAQDPAKPVLENTGKPMKLEAACGDEDIREYGLVCSEDEPCPVYLEVSSVDAVDGRIVLTGNFHTEAATIASLLLMSSDDGKTWAEPHIRIRGAVLDMVQFADANNAYASGEIAGSVSRDPFLLRSGDGGKTWKRIAVFEDAGTAGLIEQFWFDAPGQGVMLLDKGHGEGRGGRYQRLETSSGGDVWTVREAAPKPFPGKYPKGATSRNPDWRVRTDAATKVFRVEKKAGARWTPHASLAIAAGGCKPAPPKPVEPAEGAEPPKP